MKSGSQPKSDAAVRHWSPRLAREADVPALEELIPLSARALQAPYYTAAQIAAAIGPVFGVDLQLIRDGTYYVVEEGSRIVACGGWSLRESLYGGGQAHSTEPRRLDPSQDAARVRAFFVHPGWARRGIGSRIMEVCEGAIRAAGFRKVEVVATLAGEPLYASFGYQVLERLEIELPGGLSLPGLRMGKEF